MVNVTVFDEQEGERRVEQVQIDEADVEVVEISPNATHVDLTRHRLKQIDDYSWLKKVEHFSLRWNLIKKIENLEPLAPTLTYLELYDNQIEKVENLETLVNLETLDLSFNRIVKIENLDRLTKLKTLYFVHNKVEVIENLEALTELELLELGDNRIKKIENLDKNVNLIKLFLGANQITRIENVDHLKKLEVLSLPANGIQYIENLSGLGGLRELYLTQNGIQRIRGGLSENRQLEIVDLNQNRLNKIENIAHLQSLTDFWARNNQLSDWVLFDELTQLPHLNNIYLDFNPIAEADNYRGKVLRLLPQITRLDGTTCRQESLLRPPVQVQVPQAEEEVESAAQQEDEPETIETA